MEVTSAARLEAETKSELVSRLERVTRKKVKLTTEVDPDLLGGMKIRVGSTLFDGSLARALEDLRGSLRQVTLPLPEALDIGAEDAVEDSPKDDGE